MKDRVKYGMLVGVGGQSLRPRVSVLNFGFLACLEVAEKFVVGVGGWCVYLF